MSSKRLVEARVAAIEGHRAREKRPRTCLAALSAELLDDVSGQHGNIFPSLPQWRHGKPYDFQPVKQTLSESLLSKVSAVLSRMFGRTVKPLRPNCEAVVGQPCFNVLP